MHKAIKLLGIALLLIGFLWIAWDVFDGFVSLSYTKWMSQSQHLPAGDAIKRDDAIKALRELSIALKERHQELIFPASLMLIGGLIAAFGSQKRRN
jgi:hypothetical protein